MINFDLFFQIQYNYVTGRKLLSEKTDFENLLDITEFDTEKISKIIKAYSYYLSKNDSDYLYNKSFLNYYILDFFETIKTLKISINILERMHNLIVPLLISHFTKIQIENICLQEGLKNKNSLSELTKLNKNKINLSYTISLNNKKYKRFHVLSINPDNFVSKDNILSESKNIAYQEYTSKIYKLIKKDTEIILGIK